MDVWQNRSGRSVAEQGQKGIAVGSKLRGCLRLVEGHKFTGNPTDADKMRCAVVVYNNVIKVSHFYNVLRNPNYVIGKEFPFPKTFEWLKKETQKLDPIPQEDFGREGNLTDGKEGACVRACAGADEEAGERAVGGPRDADDDAEAVLIDKHERSPAQVVARKRPMGLKTAKMAKKAKKEAEKDEGGLQYALESWTKGFPEPSSASIQAANSRANINKEQSDRHYELRKEADELEAVRVLFNEDDEDSVKYRKALKRKRLRKLLQEGHGEDNSEHKEDFSVEESA
ncbi:hypothetical protein FGB62_50g013 [Gracilaria domingensis]|nr:hypothetical protein FGB62_50g013 [Gracilaria domingensis]